MYEDEDLQEIHEDIIELNEDISDLRRDLNNISASVEGSGENVILNQTVEARFKKPPLPMGNSEQESTTGANIFNFKKFLTDRNVPYTENTDGSLTFIVSGDYQSLNSQPLQFSDTDIAVSLQGLITLGTAVNVRIELLDSNNNWAGQITTSSSKTENRTASKIRFNWGDAGTVIMKNVMLNIGSTAQPYEPYVGGIASPNPDYPQEITNVTGDVEVVVENKNLAWNGWAEDFVERINYTPYAKITTLDNRNCLDYLASAGWKDYDRKYIFKTNFKENTQYTFMFDMFTDFHSGNICIEYTDGTTSEIRNLSTTAWNNVKMVSSPNKTIKYLRAQYSNGNSWIDLGTFMVYEGTEQIDFIPHKEQKFIFPLGNEKLMLGDYLADDGIHHVRRQVVFNGSEDWQDADTSSVGYSKKFLGIINEFKMRTEIICTHFKNLTTIADTNNTSIIGKAGVSYWGNNHIYFGVEKQTTEEWKAWLAEQYENEKPVILEYIRPEEVIVPYTSAQQEVYNQIKRAISYDEQTNISSNTIALFNVKAFRNMNTSIESLQSRIELLKGRS